MQMQFVLKPAKSTNTFGVRYLNKLGEKAFCVRIEARCHNGKHGETVFFYQGKDFDLAKTIANKVNYLICMSGQEAAISWKELGLQEDIEKWSK